MSKAPPDALLVLKAVNQEARQKGPGVPSVHLQQRIPLASQHPPALDATRSLEDQELEELHLFCFLMF